MHTRSRSGSNRKQSHNPFIPQPKLKDPDKIDSLNELRYMLRQLDEQLSRCSLTVRPTLDSRRSRIQARLEHLTAVQNVEIDLRHTHIDPAAFANTNDHDSVSMDDAVFVHSPTVNGSPELADGTFTGASTSTTLPPVVMSTRARILASPITVKGPNPPTASGGIRTLDLQTSLRLQQEDVDRRKAHQRAQGEAHAAKERRMAEHIEEAAAAAQSSGASSDTEHVPYVENIERRARILAFMNYHPPSDEEEEEDETDEDFNDEAMEALLEAEFEDESLGKGQQHIVDPDIDLDLLTEIIRVDPSHLDLDTNMHEDMG